LRSGVEKEFTQFYLAGHSLGGYISAQYALKYHKHIKKLLLISPIGVNPRTPEERTNVYERFKRRAKIRGRRPPPKWFMKVFKWIWTFKPTPFSFQRRFLFKRNRLGIIKNGVIRG
jgi:cardiolipin-specific phospholipase